MSEYVLVVWGLETAGKGTPPGLRGQYLVSYDVEAHDGRGTAEFSESLYEAMRFPTAMAAILAWKTQSTVCPLREDGRPNRPLTAFTMEPRAV